MPRGVRKQVEREQFTILHEVTAYMERNNAESVQQCLNALYTDGVPDDATIAIDGGRVRASWSVGATQ